MKKVASFILTRLVAGLLVVAPIYLAAFLLLKVANSLLGLVQPFSQMLDHGFRLLLRCGFRGIHFNGTLDLGTTGEYLLSEAPWLPPI